MVTVQQARDIVTAIPDPEIPVLTIGDLGIVRDVSVDGGRVEVAITPTYSGCPAMDAIRDEIVRRLGECGVVEIDVRTVFAPAWTTDWLSDEARRKLAQYGIAPPPPASGSRSCGPDLLTLGVCCPRCGSDDTRERSRFGATACQAQYVCQACLEPFDLFKAH